MVLFNAMQEQIQGCLEQNRNYQKKRKKRMLRETASLTKPEVTTFYFARPENQIISQIIELLHDHNRHNSTDVNGGF